MRETWVWSLGQEDPLEKEMTTHSSILAWKIPWTEEPGRLQSMELQRVGHYWETNTVSPAFRDTELHPVLLRRHTFLAQGTESVDSHTSHTHATHMHCPSLSSLLPHPQGICQALASSPGSGLVLWYRMVGGRKRGERKRHGSAIKKNSFESVLMRWMKLEPIIQSEVSQKDKDHYNILTHIYGI